MGARANVLGLAALLMVGAVGVWLLVDRKSDEKPEGNVPLAAESTHPEAKPRAAQPEKPAEPALPPDQPGLVRITPNAPPLVPAAENPEPPGPPKLDTEEVARDVDALQLMLRDFRTLTGENPVGTNAEIMEAVMHDNPKKARLGPPEGQKLNEKGELLDRWGTPYFFHQLSKDQMEIRSAGADRKLYTSDDIVLR